MNCRIVGILAQIVHAALELTPNLQFQKHDEQLLIKTDEQTFLKEF